MKDLFQEFETSNAAEWKKRIIRDLKGEAFESLLWQNDNGFTLNPFYTAEDLQSDYFPAFHHSGWEVCAGSTANKAATVNKELLDKLNRGATSISVNVNNHEPASLLNQIQLQYIKASFYCDLQQVNGLCAYLTSEHPAALANITLFPVNLSTGKEKLEWFEKTSVLRKAGAITTATDGLAWARLGALPYYELALVFSSLAEWLELCEKEKISPGKSVAVRTEVTSDLFVQLCKLRAMRRLWELFKKEFNISSELYIIAETSLINKSVSDQHNNLIRSSVESMAAIAGGCNELLVHEFDVLSGENTNAGKRLAINQQLILKEECYFDKMADVACGSFYLESLTDKLAEKALESFKEIMAEGGFSKIWQNGTIKEEIKKQYSLQEKKVRNKEIIVVGVNKFQDKLSQKQAPGSILNHFENKGIRNFALSFEVPDQLNKA